jgi:hypothetical protein
MLVTFLLVGISGLLMGFWLRASALILGSILVLGISVSASIINGRELLSALAASMALLATLQAGYLFGLLIQSLARSVVSARRHG